MSQNVDGVSEKPEMLELPKNVLIPYLDKENVYTLRYLEYECDKNNQSTGPISIEEAIAHGVNHG